MSFLLAALAAQALMQDGMLTIIHSPSSTEIEVRKRFVCNDRESSVEWRQIRNGVGLEEVRIEGTALDAYNLDKIRKALRDRLIEDVSLMRCDILNGIYHTQFLFELSNEDQTNQKSQFLAINLVSRTVSIEAED